MKQALLLIDIQNDYFEGGKNPLHHPEQAAAQARRLLDFFRDSDLPVIHIRHISLRPGSTFFLPDTEGAEINASVGPAGGERVIVKHAPSAFLQTELAEELGRLGITQLVVCGMMSHMCIDTTVRAAQDHGLSVTLIEDACTTKDLVWEGRVLPADIVHQTIMASLNGVFAQVVTADEFLKQRAVK
jgi:nicotinamidase-related amidase